MKRILENINCQFEYYIDENTGIVYRTGYKNKFLKVPKKRGKYGNYYYLYCYDNNRYKEKRFFSSFLIGKYIFNIKDDAYIVYKDNDVFNDEICNIDIVYLQSICKKWVDIRNYEDYLISYDGVIFSKERLQIMQPITIHSGYKYICLKSKTLKIHKLVYSSFTKDFVDKENYVIDHIDNNPSNNSYDNLQYIHNIKNTSKDHKKSDGLPTGVTFLNGVYRTHITYTLNNIQYKHVWLGNSDTPEEASKLYDKAFLMINDNINPIKVTNNKFIKYCFKNNKWFLSFSKSHSDITNETIFYDTPEEIEKILINSDFINALQLENKKINKLLNSLTEKNALLTNTISDKEQENSVLKEKYNKLKIQYNILLESIKKYKKNKLQTNETIKTLKEKLRVINQKEKLQNVLLRQKCLRDFATKENYQKNSYNDCYTINIPYSDGKRYYLASFANFDIVQELDELINEHKYQDDFVEWFNDFKENRLQFYLDKDKIYRTQKINKEQNNKGYKWFKPRNCWRVTKSYHNKEYMLGYFKNEDCCKMMVNEANHALEMGVFEKWFEKITEHRERIKELFNC